MSLESPQYGLDVSLMEVSNIKTFQSDRIIHILIEYPKVKVICKKVLIYPAAQHYLNNDTP